MEYPFEYRQALTYFRTLLEVYDEIVDHKVFCIEEIYYRCLTEGAAFTKFIKKSRQQSLQAKESMINIPLNDEFIHPEYSGYDSIIHERYLINWDDSGQTIDWPYSLLEVKKDYPEEELANIIRSYLAINEVDKYTYPDIIDLIEPVAGKKSESDDAKHTVLLKDTWTITNGGLWHAIRRVVPTQTGSTRDTGVPTTDTLCMLKLIHLHARNLSQELPHLANVNYELLNRRIDRVLKGNRFLHVDFKKFGLTFPRQAANTLLRIIGKDHLQIKELVLETDEGPILTTRGGVLGWFDPLVAITTAAILFSIKVRYKWEDMDFIVFNDDVEISFIDRNREELEFRKFIIIRELEFFDFVVSHRKVWAGNMFIFLEQYMASEWTLDMSKRQLQAVQFAKSLCTPYRWEAKYFYAEGHRHIESITLKEACMNSIDYLYPDEYEKPVELGGWTYFIEDGLNKALENASPQELYFYTQMLRYKEPDTMPKMRLVSLDVQRQKIEERYWESWKPSITLFEVERDQPMETFENEILQLIFNDPGHEYDLRARRPVIIHEGDGRSYDG